VRYTEEEKHYIRSTSTFWTSPGFNTTIAMNRTDTWTDTSPMASLDYQFTDNVLLYGRIATGFKSGGFNGRANNPGEDAPYDPELVTSYEVGIKSDWFNNMLRANFAVFYNDYEDFQARISGVTNDVPPSPSLTVLNAGQLEISGAELELVYRPARALTLDAQIGYLDASYGEFEDARFPGGSRAFQTPAFSPEWTARFGANYRIDLPNGQALELNGSARYRSEMALAIDNTVILPGNIGTTTPIDGLFTDDYWLYDASITWRPTDIFSVALVGRNLGDEIYKTDGQDFSSVGDIRTVYYGPPRTVSLVLTARY
jgi:iron complex outermembrane receptor protein